MKRQFIYSVLAILALTTIIGVAFAQPTPIGTTRQPVPFESNPSAYTAAGMGVVSNPTNMWDGSLASYCDFKIGSGFGSSGNLVVKGFETPLSPFQIGWVDLKIKYWVPFATIDDTYRIEYTTDNWVNTEVLLPDTGEQFDVLGGAPPVRPWAQIAPSQGGAWTWANLAALQVRVWATRVVSPWDGNDMYMYEVWATVYPMPPPPTSSPTLSIQPANVTSGPSGAYVPNYVFVDLYVMDMTNMLGYEVVVDFDPGVLQCFSASSYYPFKSEAITPAWDNVAGWVSIAYYTFGGDNIGLIGNAPIARIYFSVVSAPSGMESALSFSVDKITDVTGNPIVHTTYGGWFNVAQYLSAWGASYITIDLNNPIGTTWHEIYPTYCTYRDIDDWTDNGDGYLSASDEILMSDGLKYHVDEVTTTIWWEIKPGDPYGWDGMEMAVEPEVPTTEDIPGADVIESKWHQIYPPDMYSLTFTIKSFDDNGDGVLGVSDQIDFEYDFDPGMIHWAHITAVSTDIIVTPVPEIPEFPFGIGLIMLLAPAIPLAYLWRLRRKVTKQ